VKRVAIVVAAMLLAAACASRAPTADDGAVTTLPTTDLVVAVGGPFSGANRPVGDQIRAGARLAAAQVNATGGISGGPRKGAKLVIDDGFDDADLPERALANVKRVIDDPKYVAFVGSANSDGAVASAPNASQAGLSYLSAVAASPRVLEAAKVQKSVFLLPPSSAAQGMSVADEVARTGFHRPAVLHIATTHAEALADNLTQRLKDKGVTVVAREPFPPGAADFVAPLGRIKAVAADALVVVGPPDTEAVILKQVDQFAVRVVVYDAGGGGGGDAFLKAAGPLANGLVGLAFVDPARTTAAWRSLQAAWTAETREAVIPDPAAFAYEGVQAVAAAFADGAAGRLEVSDHLHRISLADTGVGPLRFSPDGSRLGGRIYVFQVVAGKPIYRTAYEQAGPTAVKEVGLER